MSQFTITRTRRVDADVAEFVVRFNVGGLAVGDTFRCFVTHHPVDFKVASITESGSQAVLVCDGTLGYDGEFAGAMVDTLAASRPEAFRYEKHVV